MQAKKLMQWWGLGPPVDTPLVKTILSHSYKLTLYRILAPSAYKKIENKVVHISVTV